jgi:hypothetical protein
MGKILVHISKSGIQWEGAPGTDFVFGDTSISCRQILIKQSIKPIKPVKPRFLVLRHYLVPELFIYYVVFLP